MRGEIKPDPTPCTVIYTFGVVAVYRHAQDKFTQQLAVSPGLLLAVSSAITGTPGLAGFAGVPAAAVGVDHTRLLRFQDAQRHFQYHLRTMTTSYFWLDQCSMARHDTNRSQCADLPTMEIFQYK